MFARYVQELLCWAAFHALWQGTLILVGFHLWQRVARPEPRAVYRAAVCAVASFPAFLLLTTAAAHVALFENAKLGGNGALLFAEFAAPPLLAKTVNQAFESVGILTLAWATGALVLLLRMALGLYRISRVLRNCLPANIETCARVRNLAQQLNVAMPRVLVGAGHSGPFVVGFTPGVLVLPAVAAPSDEWDALVLHELAHIARRDITSNWWLRCICTVLWFHPAIWMLVRAGVQAREEACDDASVAHSGKALVLARALVTLEERRATHGALIAASDGSLAKRVRRLLRRELQPSSKHLNATRSNSYAVCAIACGATALAAAGVMLSVSLAPSVDHMAVSGAASGVLAAVRTHIDAHDPAGTFTVVLLNGRVASATVGGVPVARTSIHRNQSTVSLTGIRGEPLVAMQLDPRGAIRWMPRSPSEIRSQKTQ